MTSSIFGPTKSNGAKKREELFRDLNQRKKQFKQVDMNQLKDTFKTRGLDEDQKKPKETEEQLLDGENDSDFDPEKQSIKEVEEVGEEGEQEVEEEVWDEDENVVKVKDLQRLKRNADESDSVGDEELLSAVDS